MNYTYNNIATYIDINLTAVLLCIMSVKLGHFEWDPSKDSENKRKHGLSFLDAAQAFSDPNRILTIDEKHSQIESRMFCLGRVGTEVVTVRFTYRNNIIRIIGAGFWRKGKKFYEKENR